MRGGQLNDLERASHVVPKHPEEQIAFVFDLSTEKRDRFGDRLIDRLIKAIDVSWIDGGELACFCPKVQHAGTQGAVFGGQLIHGKTALRPQERVGFGLRVASFRRSIRATL
jgi:hypothetical protein